MNDCYSCKFLVRYDNVDRTITTECQKQLDHAISEIGQDGPECLAWETDPDADGLFSWLEHLQVGMVKYGYPFSCMSAEIGNGWIKLLFHDEGCEECGEIFSYFVLVGPWTEQLAKEEDYPLWGKAAIINFLEDPWEELEHVCSDCAHEIEENWGVV